MEKLKVLIVDRNILHRKQVADAVDLSELGKVEQIASSSTIAIEWLNQSSMDVVILDVCMLKTDGMDMLKAIKRDFQDVEIIITSTPDPGDAVVTLEALKSGALDFVLISRDANEHSNVQSIMSHLQMLFVQVKVKKYSQYPHGDSSHDVEEKAGSGADKVTIHKVAVSREKKKWTGADLVLIASSTGGPNALETVLPGLPSDFSTPILVVQHMPPDFTGYLAKALDKKCRIRVYEAQHSDTVAEGRVLIAPGGLHMTVDLIDNSQRIIKLENTPFVNGVRPSADVLFHTIAKAYEGKNILAIILTGMGNDGTAGVTEIKNKCNCYCITQSEKTCVVYGMPRNVYVAGLSDEVADIGMIAERIVKFSQSGDREK